MLPSPSKTVSGVATFSLLLVIGASTVACNKLKEKVTGGASGAAAPEEATNLLTGFEGDLGVKLTMPKQKPFEVMLQVKADRTRVNLQGQAADATGAIGMQDGYGILQMKEKRAYFVSDSAKKAIVLDLEHAKEQIPGFGQGAGAGGGAPTTGGGGGAGTEKANQLKIKKTGKTDRVAGYACEEWEASDASQPESKMLACVANQGASWLALPVRALPGNVAALAELLDGKHFPLRFIALKRDVEEGRLEITKVEKKALADSLFAVPQGYQEVDLMTAIFGGLGNIGNAGGSRGGLPRGGAGGLPPGLRFPPGVPPGAPQTKPK
jgi:hypothetical protein